ncbi:SpoIID/LytB domain-containing protein, partial [Nitrospiraceae bacterium AH_259_D15_M11_P09]|nr:SpoIID/LytB domain-containing protein [Nitrospiraceae bacterium AH_259_D15_M11_P09]
MRRIFGLCLLLQMLLPGPSSEASDLIRVLIFEHAKRLEMSAAPGVSLTLADGDTRTVRSPLVLRPWAGRMLVNGKPLQTSLVTVGGRGGELTVTAEDAPAVGWEIGPRTIVVGGTVRVFSRDGGLVVVNEVELEEYVKGVVPLEMNAGWHPEALKV